MLRFYNHSKYFGGKFMFEVEVFWLIWLLRSQGKAIGQRNNGFGGLGIELYDLICNSLGGRLIAHKIYADWAGFGIRGTIGNYGLPKTSEKYLISVNQIPNLLTFINRHS
jgi:hypothetical protein